MADPDLDDIVKAAQQLVARKQWQPLLDADFHPRLIVDSGGRIAAVNLLALELFNYPESMMLGHLVEEFMPERFREMHVGFRTKFFERPTRRAMGGGMDLVVQSRGGLEVRVDIGLAPLRIEEGTFVSITLQRKA